jgi:hypothetical protein
MVLKILKFFVAVAFIFFLFMVIVQLDMGRNNLQYAVLMKDALIMSLKFQVIALPIYLLFFKRD